MSVLSCREVDFTHAGNAAATLVDVGFEVTIGESIGLVGASGSGKSTLARVLVLLDRPARGRISWGDEVVFDASREPTVVGAAPLRQLRRRIQYVFQDAGASLDPRRTIGDIVLEGLDHFGLEIGSSRRSRATAVLAEVGLGDLVTGRFPRELSGGERQRVAIARSLALDPDVLILDEPTSALDVMTQVHILDLLSQRRRDRRTAVVVVSHDMAIVGRFCDRLLVMEKGRIVEDGPTQDLFRRPGHPYTKALMAAAGRAVGPA